MIRDACVTDTACGYLWERAPLLLLIFSSDHVVLEANRHAQRVMGGDLVGRRFADIVAKSHEPLDLDAISSDAGREQLINVMTPSGVPQSYYCLVRRIGDRHLILGHMDTDEVETMRKAVLTLNQDLANTARELHRKNAGLKRLNDRLQAANATILELTRTDSLTDVANRRYFDERLLEMVSLARRTGHPVALVLTDIDHFKVVNDTFGHDVGDQALVGYAELMKHSIRLEDLVARYGGEEFILLLPDTDATGAFGLAERIRQALEQADLLAGRHRLTASFGVSQFQPDESIESFIKRADTAMYAAKAGGRNRTVVAP